MQRFTGAARAGSATMHKSTISANNYVSCHTIITGVMPRCNPVMMHQMLKPDLCCLSFFSVSTGASQEILVCFGSATCACEQLYTLKLWLFVILFCEAPCEIAGAHSYDAVVIKRGIMTIGP